MSNIIVTNTNNSGAGSLRAAIEFANANGGSTIVFNIPGSDRAIINLTSALPKITASIVIDGYSQSGAAKNTLANGNNAVIKIVLNGSGTGIPNGLELTDTASGSTIEGLEIRGFAKEGILLLGDNNIVRGNFITNNGGDGIQVGDGAISNSNASSGNIIGGANSGDRNVISGNGDEGIDVKRTSANNIIKGNFIGTTFDGTAVLANDNGIQLDNATLNQIGGVNPGDRNVIAANRNNGVLIAGGMNNQIKGNFIGTNAAGTELLGNGEAGIVVAGSSNNTIGGTALGEGNLIAGNQIAGVAIATANLPNNSTLLATGNTVVGNQIRDNQGLGIDLGQVAIDINGKVSYGSIGITPNDTGDADTGANGLQNFPVLVDAAIIDETAVVMGRLNTTANTTVRIEFFSNGALDGNGQGEEQTLLGSTTVTTNASGTIEFEFATNLTNAPAGQFITATATRLVNGVLKDTSEFSQGIEIKQFAAVARNDFDGDGRADMFWHVPFGNNQPTEGSNRLFRMGQGGVLKNSKLLSIPSGMQAAAVADFNGDGKADILWRNPTTGDNRLFLMDRSGVATNARILKTPAQWETVKTGDFNGDGKADIFWRDAETNYNRLFLMNGAEVISNVKMASPPANFELEKIADFNGDGKDDIFWRDAATGENRLFLMDGATVTDDRSFLNTTMQVAAVADFTGDGKADILWRDPNTGANRLFEMDGTRVVQNAKVLSIGSSMEVAGVADFDGDGKADIFWRNTATGENRLFLMEGATAKTNSRFVSMNDSFEVMTIDDFNGDGKADIFWRNPTTGANRLVEMNGVNVIRNSSVLGIDAAYQAISA